MKVSLSFCLYVHVRTCKSLSNLVVTLMHFIFLSDDPSIDDIYEDSSPEQMKPKKKATKSPYFDTNSDTDFEEKKEEDAAATFSKTNKASKKRILEDSDSDEDVGFGFSTFQRHDAAGDALDETPVKSTVDADDYVEDEEEAIAIVAAMKNSVKDHKRLKKKAKKTKKSSLEMIPSTEKKSKVIYLDDLEEEEPEVASDDNGDEISVASHTSNDEEQKTAAQVLQEANALSAKIVNIVGAWCGTEEVSTKGLILGEGALSMGGGGGSGSENIDNEWISRETMKKILPKVELAEYQLLGVNWMALLNRLTFMKSGKMGTKGKKHGSKMNVNGILAE